MLRVAVLLGALAAAQACASPRVSDTDQPDPALAYVVIYLQIDHVRAAGSEGAVRADRIVIDRVEPKGKRVHHGMVLVPDRQPVLLALKPGLYYLARTEFLPSRWQEGYHPRVFLFEATAGRLNVAGVWHITGVPDPDDANRVLLRHWTSSAPEEIERMAASFPKLLSKLPVASSFVPSEPPPPTDATR